MPTRPPKLIKPWNKPSLTSGVANRERDPFYHTNRWKMASKRFIENNPLCKECKKKGLLTPSVITDHRIPKDKCADPLDQDNWDPLCKPCHSVKSAQDKKHFK